MSSPIDGHILLMLFAIGLLVFGFSRLIVSVRQVREYMKRSKSK